MNGVFRIGILTLLGVVVVTGVISASLSHENPTQILTLCTLVSVSLLAILHQSTAIKVDSVAKETTEVRKQTDGITKELVKKSEKVAFDAGKDVGEHNQKK